MDRLPERVEARISPEPNTGCWLWTGARTHLGYGRVLWEGKNRYAQRVIYALLRRPIPAGLQLDHLCRVPACVNPQHLEVVTQRENLRRGMGCSARNTRKISALCGHPYDAVTSQGARICLACYSAARREYSRENYEKYRTYMQEYRRTHRAQCREYERKYERKRRAAAAGEKENQP